MAGSLKNCVASLPRGLEVWRTVALTAERQHTLPSWSGCTCRNTHSSTTPEQRVLCAEKLHFLAGSVFLLTADGIVVLELVRVVLLVILVLLSSALTEAYTLDALGGSAVTGCTFSALVDRTASCQTFLQS